MSQLGPPPQDPPPASPVSPSTTPPPPPGAPVRVVVPTIPTRRSIVGACAAPLIGYAVTLGVALALMVLVVIAFAVGSGGDADLSGGLDTTAVGTLAGLPVQLTAMALGGSLSLGGADLGAAVFGPPLLLTATFAVSVFWWARRAERAVASRSTLERAILSGSSAVVAAVVVTVVTRLLAMRDDGVVMQAATPGLFLGVLALAFTAHLLGRQAATASLWPAWLPADGRRAVHLVAQHVLVYVAVVIPLAAAWLMITAGVEEGLLALIWGPTVGVYAFALGHLGAATTTGAREFAWDLGWFPALALVLLALMLTTTAAVAWHLRRGEDRALLARPVSWAALPAAYAVGALVVCLASTVRVSGVFLGAEGGFTITVGYWLIPVLALWGAGIEALSRQVAPRVAGTLPPTLARRLGTGPSRWHTAPAPPVQRIPMSPADRSRARAGLIVAGVVGGVALAGFVTVSIVGSTMFSPRSVAESYLDAVVDGDVDSVVEMAPVGDEASDALLTSEVYGAAAARITGYDITEVEEFAGRVTVTVDLEGVEDGQDVELVLTSQGTRVLLFDDWQVDEGGLASAMTVPIPESSDSLVVNGVQVPVEPREVAELWALPGSYEIDPYGGSRWLEPAGTETVVPAASFGVYAELADPEPSAELRDVVDAELADYVQGCMASDDPAPEGCPQEAFLYGDDVRDLTWTLDEMPALSWDSFYGSFPVDLYSDVDGRATVTYEYDESYGFGQPAWVQESDETTLYVTATVDLVDGEPQVTFGD